MSPFCSLNVTALMLVYLAKTTFGSAAFSAQNRFVVNEKKDVVDNADVDRKGEWRASTRVRRQDLVGLPSWTSPDFCYETGQIRDMASLMVDPPPSKTLDYTSLCSEVLRPTKTISTTSTQTGDSVIIVTTTATYTTSTTTTEYSQSTTTALCPLPSPSSSLRCSIPALGFSTGLLYHRTHLSPIACHELCLSDKKCKSFQIVQQDNEELKYTRCNIYKTRVEGYVSEPGDERSLFWDRGCGELSAPGCAKKPQKRKREELDENCCRLERLPSVTPTLDTEIDQQEESGTVFSLEESIRVERDEESEFAEEISLSDVDEGIRVERREELEPTVEHEGSLNTDQRIRVERDEIFDSTKDESLISTGEGIRVEKRRETSAQAARNGYILSRQLSRSKRAPDDHVVFPYRFPLPDEDGTITSTSININIPPSISSPDIGVIRIERTNRDLTPERPIDPLITPAPDLPIFVPTKAEGDGDGVEQGIRVEKRDGWTTPDFLRTFFPLFITLACSCLVTSAKPAVTSSVVEVVQVWNYTTTTSTKSEVYRFTENPSWSTVYRTVA